MTNTTLPAGITDDPDPAHTALPKPGDDAAPSGSPQAGPRHRWRPGSAARLACLHALVLATVLGGSVIALVRNSRSGNEEIAARQLSAELGAFRGAAVARAPGTDLLTFAEGYLRTHAVASGDAVIVAVTAHGTVGSPGAAGVLADLGVQHQLAQPPARTTLRSSRVNAKQVELLVAPLVENGRTVGTFLGAGDLSMFDSVQSRILGVSVLEAFIALFVGVMSAFLLLRRLLRTIGRITTTADAIGQGSLDERLGDQGTDDEVGQLAKSFDAMLERVEDAVGAQRRLVSDVSHQLRTPLTVARGHLEVLTRTGLGDSEVTRETVDLVVDELDHMRMLIERFSVLGQAMEPDSVTIEHLELRAFLTEVHEACKVMAPRRWVLRPVPAIWFAADVAKLRGALFNVVDNAVKATSRGKGIELAAGVDGGDVRISIGDSGQGIPAPQRAAVLGRFSRPGARDAGGSGLGLAIVKAVAEAHGGSVEVGSSTLGGAEVTIVIPIGVA